MSLLEREYQRCIAATRAPAAELEPIDDGPSNAEASEAAEAAGYSALGECSDDEEGGDDEDGCAGYAALGEDDDSDDGDEATQKAVDVLNAEEAEAQDGSSSAAAATASTVPSADTDAAGSGTGSDASLPVEAASVDEIDGVAGGTSFAVQPPEPSASPPAADAAHHTPP